MAENQNQAALPMGLRAHTPPHDSYRQGANPVCLDPSLVPFYIAFDDSDLLRIASSREPYKNWNLALSLIGTSPRSRRFE
jgi:hypothetical protein